MISFPLFNLPYCVKKFKSRKNLSLIFFHRYVQPSLISSTFSKSSLKWFTINLCIVASVFIHFALSSPLPHFTRLCSLCAGWMWLFISADWRPSYSPARVSGREEGGTPLTRPVCRVSQCPGLAALNSQAPTSPSPSALSAPDPWYEISRSERSVYIDLEKVINKNIASSWDIVYE